MSTFTFIALYSDFPSAPPRVVSLPTRGSGQVRRLARPPVPDTRRIRRRGTKWPSSEESGPVGENSRGSSRDLRFSFHTQTAAGSEGKLMAVIFTVHREELLWEQLCKTNKKRWIKTTSVRLNEKKIDFWTRHTLKLWSRRSGRPTVFNHFCDENKKVHLLTNCQMYKLRSHVLTAPSKWF